jgi:hypothetical protein
MPWTTSLPTPVSRQLEKEGQGTGAEVVENEEETLKYIYILKY